MKKIVVLFLTLTMMFSLCACGNTARSERGGDGISVVAASFPAYDFARAVLGGTDNLIMLLAPGEEVHTYDPSPSDIIAIENCDVFIYGGGESDTWVSDVLSSFDSSKLQIVSMMDACALLEEEEIEGGEETHDHEHGAEETEYDEHVWTSPVNAAEICRAVCAAVCAADETHSAAYTANAESYISSIDALDDDFRALCASAENKTLIFGDRFPFLYFVREYGLDYFAAFPGCASNTEPSAATVAFLIDKVREENIGVIFKLELSTGKTADAVAEGAGNAQVRTMYSCQTLSKDDFDAGETYVSLMRRNLETLSEVLG